MDCIIFIICCLNASDIISIINILVSSVLWIWIGSTFQRNLAANREVKNYFIEEIKDIKLCYSGFMKKINSKEANSKFIIEWFKRMSIKISIYNKFLRKEFKIENSLILDKHNELKQFITNTHEINEDYNKKYVNFNTQTIIEIYKLHAELSELFTKRIIEINRGEKRFKWLYSIKKNI